MRAQNKDAQYQPPSTSQPQSDENTPHISSLHYALSYAVISCVVQMALTERHTSMHPQLPFQVIGWGASSASEACPASTTIGRAPADSETTLAWLLFPLHCHCPGAPDGGCIASSCPLILHRLLRYTYTAPKVPRTRHSRFRYCPIYGVSCIDGSPCAATCYP